MTKTLSLVGASVGKKRKRCPGANHVRKNEVKIVNMIDGSTPSADYANCTVSSMYLSTATGNNFGAWYPFKLNWPGSGTASGQRIGDKIYMKYLRIKGSIGVMNRVLVGIRWRLRFIRADTFTFSSGAIAGVTSYLGIYRAKQNPDLADTVQYVTEALKAKHNFYMMYKDVEKRNQISSKVIASGYFPPSNYVREGIDIQAGTGGTVTHTLNISPLLTSSYYSVPLDIKLKCNDWVDCSDTSYYLVMETDFPFGFSYNDATEHGWGYSLDPEMAPFKANFFALGYFTDP